MSRQFSHENQKPSHKFSQLFHAFSNIQMQQGFQQLQNFVNPIETMQTKSPMRDFENRIEEIAQKFNPMMGIQELEQKLFGSHGRKRGMEQKIATSVQMASNKFGEAIQELTKAFQELEVSQISNEEEVALVNNQEQVKLQTENDNEFIGQEFGSVHKLQQVQKYCDDLKNENVENYINETENRRNQQVQAAQKIQNIFKKALSQSLQSIFQHLFKYRPSQSQNRQSDSERPSTGHRQIIKGSSQSQRIKSASKRGSDAGSDQFNFDLTIKTRNSKNPFKSLVKQDSLMYSAQSDFGYHPSSPQKLNEKERPQSQTENKKLQQIQDAEEETLKNVDKSQSEEYQPSNYEGKTEQLQNENEEDEEDEENDRNKNEKKSQQFQEKEQNDEYDLEKNKQRQEQLDNQFQIPSNLSHSHKKDRLTQNNSPKGQKSIQEQIEDHSDGFYADDQDQKQFQSARYEKKDIQKIFKKRVGTEVAVAKNSVQISKKNIKRFNKVDFSREQKISHSNSQSNIFATQISNYQSKIAKLKEVKELKKKKLEEELAKVNQQIQILHQKEEETSHQNMNHYASRAKISDNVQAKKKAQILVKNLRSQKRNRNMAKIGQFKSLDRNINDYMEELTKLRAQNEQKIKQKKKLQILERMKQHEIRKMNDRKKIEANQQFVMHLKSPIKQQHESPKKSRISQKEEQIQIVTPELDHKKAYLNKIRSFSVKKSKRDVYEQVLS